MISIIIPLYNVQDYIIRCLESVVSQTFKGTIECLIIDDCSQDNSIQLVNSFVASYNGDIVFRIIHHEQNRGVSAARNTGISESKGDWLFFLDSDDWIIPECISILTDAVLKYGDVEMVVGNYSVVGGEFTTEALTTEGLYHDDIVKNTIVGSLYGMPWNKLVSRSFLLTHNLFFAEGVNHEDVLWSLQVACYLKSLYVSGVKTYIYNVHANSIVTSETVEEYESNMSLIKILLLNFVFKNKFDDNPLLFNCINNGLEENLLRNITLRNGVCFYLAYRKSQYWTLKQMTDLGAKRKDRIISMNRYLPFFAGLHYVKIISRLYKLKKTLATKKKRLFLRFSLLRAWFRILQERLCLKKSPKILIDLTDIHPEMLFWSIPLYTFRFLDAIPESLVKEFTLFVGEDIEPIIKERYPNFVIRVWHLGADWTPDGYNAEKWYINSSYKLHVDSSRYDVVFIPSDLALYTEQRFSRTKKCIVIHDQKSIFDDEGKIIEYKYSFYHNKIVNSDQIIAISKYTKDEIIRIHHIDSSKIDVVYNSVSLTKNCSRPTENLPAQYILYVNTLQKYKNPLTLLRAFNEIKDRIQESLVFVGIKTDYWYESLQPFIVDNHLSDRVFVLSDISDEDLRYCYEHASLFVTTSTCEGFGYTPIEAAIYGCPVISSTCGSLPEVTKCKVDYYEPFDNYSQLSERIMWRLNHPRSKDEIKSISDFFLNMYSVKNQFEYLYEILKKQ